MQIQNMSRLHAEAVIEMMRTFYASPAVFTNGSEAIFRADVEACVSDSPYLEGYVFIEDSRIVGYGMLAKSFSTEFGKPCIWIEDIYLLPSCRGRGYGGQFLSFVETRYPEAILRLEVEEENEIALHTYQKNGFDTLPYLEMKKNDGASPLPVTKSQGSI
jgi:GNAT superfamily N-acetyltransferase